MSAVEESSPLAKQFRVGSSVWCKLSSPYPWWPCKVVDTSKDGIDLVSFGDRASITVKTLRRVRPLGCGDDQALVERGKKTLKKRQSLLEEFNKALGEVNLQGPSPSESPSTLAACDDKASATSSRSLPGATPTNGTQKALFDDSSIFTPNTHSKSAEQISRVRNISTPVEKLADERASSPSTDVLCQLASSGKKRQRRGEGVGEGQGEGLEGKRITRARKPKRNKEEREGPNGGVAETPSEQEEGVAKRLDYTMPESETSTMADVLQGSSSSVSGCPPKKRKKLHTNHSEPPQDASLTSGSSETKGVERAKQRRGSSNGLAELAKDQERLAETRKERSRSTTPGNPSLRKTPTSPTGLGSHRKNRSSSLEKGTARLTSKDGQELSASSEGGEKIEGTGTEETTPSGAGKYDTANLPEGTAQGETTPTTVTESAMLSDLDSDSDMGGPSPASSDSDDDLPTMNFEVDESVNVQTVKSGKVMWAKCDKHPYWPAIVERTEKTPGKKARSLAKATVRFFGCPNEPSTILQPRRNLVPFGTQRSDQFIEEGKAAKEDINMAVEDAMKLLNMRAAGEIQSNLFPEQELDLIMNLRPRPVVVRSPISKTVARQPDTERHSDDDDPSSVVEDSLQQLFLRPGSPMDDSEPEEDPEGTEEGSVYTFENVTASCEELKPLLTDIVKGKAPSTYHNAFTKGMRKDKEKLKLVKKFGPIKKWPTIKWDQLIKQLAAMANEASGGNLDYHYAELVLLPEAMVRVVMKLEGLSYQDAREKL